MTSLLTTKQDPQKVLVQDLQPMDLILWQEKTKPHPPTHPLPFYEGVFIKEFLKINK